MPPAENSRQSSGRTSKLSTRTTFSTVSTQTNPISRRSKKENVWHFALFLKLYKLYYIIPSKYSFWKYGIFFTTTFYLTIWSCRSNLTPATQTEGENRNDYFFRGRLLQKCYSPAQQASYDFMNK